MGMGMGMGMGGNMGMMGPGQMFGGMGPPGGMGGMPFGFWWYSINRIVSHLFIMLKKWWIFFISDYLPVLKNKYLK
jgi:hypothetical protein